MLYEDQNTETIPIMIPPDSSPIQPVPVPCHCRMGRAAPVLLFVDPLVLDAKPADTVVVALLVPVLVEVADEVVELE